MSGSDTIAITINNANSTVFTNNFFRYKLPIPFSVGSDMEVCLASGYLYNSNFNVMSMFGNNTFSLIFPTAGAPVTIPVTIPNGFYDVNTGLNGFMDFVSFANNFYLINSSGQNVYFVMLNENSIYYTVTFTATPTPSPSIVIPYVAGTYPPAGQYMYPPAGWGGVASNLPATPMSPQLVISNAAFGALIGFTTGTYPATPSAVLYDVNGSLTPEIEPQYAYNINTNLVNSALYNSAPNAFFQFTWNVSFGQQQQITPFQYQWYTLQQNQYNEITISFTDQNNQPLYLNDPNTQITIFMRKKESRSGPLKT